MKTTSDPKHIQPHSNRSSDQFNTIEKLERSEVRESHLEAFQPSSVRSAPRHQYHPSGFPVPSAMLEYRFKPLSKLCAGTGAPLQPGSLCHSILVERDGVFERLDFSEEAWTGLPPEAVGYWRCAVPIPAPVNALTTNPESLLRFFEQLVESSNPQQQKLCYVLALTLLQRRRLKLDCSRFEEDREILQLSGSRGEGPFEILDQKLSAEELAALRAALEQELTSSGEAA